MGKTKDLVKPTHTNAYHQMRRDYEEHEQLAREGLISKPRGKTNTRSKRVLPF